MKKRIEPLKYEFKPFSKKQKTILTWWMPNNALSGRYGIIADGSVRSGKTMSMSLSFVIWAMSTFNGRFFGMCGKSHNSLRRNVVEELKKMLHTIGYSVDDRRTESVLIISKGNVSNAFYLFGGVNERSQDVVQGITLAGCYLDEAALMPENFVNQVTLRCSVEGARIWFNCNPAGSSMHWFKREWIDQYKTKNLLYLHFTMDDNLSLSEKTKQIYRSRYVGMYYRRYIEGRWVAAEGVIYDMWDEVENMYSDADVPESYAMAGTRYIGVDYGTTNPMVFLDCVDYLGNLWIKNEYYYNCRATIDKAQKTDAQYANDFEEFVEHDHSVTVIIDPSAESFKCELRNRGYRIKDADNTVNDGIRVTSTMIKKRRLRVLKGKTPNLLKEVQAYVWDEKAATEHGEERPVKQNDHAMDAMRYLCKTLITRRRL